MSGSTAPEVGTLGMLEEGGRFQRMTLAIWTGHGWLPIRGLHTHQVQVRMERMDRLGGGWGGGISALREVELSATLDYQPMPVPPEAPRFNPAHVTPGQELRREPPPSFPITVTGRMTGAAMSAPSNPPRALLREEELQAAAARFAQIAPPRVARVGLDYAAGEPRIHPLDDPPAPPRTPPVGSRVEADAIHREQDSDPARPRNRRIRFLEE